MNVALLKKHQKVTESTYKGTSAPQSARKFYYQEEEMTDFSTIDGGVITYNAGTKAVSSGAGIFIGDYFVGVAEHFHMINTPAYIRY
ncbi:hypothetical protein [Pontibacter liquoris]|uniref:hypothetical protein n=1 Tax=Pontibacter liquoris TaxID=2905677 RepID=UPI001FA72F68|nr:hypothetical protein [Pontibacter liquoris]